MFCGAIDRATGHMSYCQAGYPSPYYADPDGRVQEIGDGGFPVGLFSEAEFQSHDFVLEKGGRLVLCSDAACEAEDPMRNQFGVQRLRNVIATFGRTETAELPGEIVRELNAWRSGALLEDDLTVVALGRIKHHDSD